MRIALPRRRFGRRMIVALVVAGLLSIAAASAVAGPGDIGYEGPSYAGGTTEITGEKPESKLWWNDGHWWASMFDTGSSDFHIFRLDVATQSWIDTGVAIDPRTKSKADTLWDQANQKLYVASHVFATNGNTSEPARLWRYSYNAATNTYSLDNGFPVVIAAFSGETLVIDKDSTGQLWATWKQGTQIMVNRTTCPATGSCPLSADATWGTPFVPNIGITGAETVNADDISSLIAFGGKIGVMWSNQVKKGFYFAVHNDADGNDLAWGGAAKIPATGTSAFSDDHLNIKLHTADGRLFVAAKTSLGASQARLVLLVRHTSGAWSVFDHSKGSDNMTRPIVMIDRTNNVLHYFATEEGGGSLYVKKTPLSSISFGPGKGTPVIVDADSAEIENPSSAKHSVDATTGLVVLASNDLTKRYWHHYDPLDGTTPPPPANTLPVAIGDTYTMTKGGVLNVPAPGVLANDTDADGDPLTATKVANPSNGTATLNANGSLTYTPSPTFTGVDSFTYTASDGTGASNEATVTITVDAPGGTTSFTPAADSFVRSNFPTENNGSLTTLRERKSGADETRSYLKFTVTGLSGAPTSARLRLFVTDASTQGGAVYAVTDSTWVENTITWNTKPALGSLLGNLGAVVLGEWVEINVTSVVTGNGTFSFALGGQISDAAYYSSKEGANPPQLVVGGSGGGGNAAPVANNDSYSMTQGGTLNVLAPGVLGNDTDANSDPLSAVKVTDPASGTLALDSNGSFTYTPSTVFTGTDSFTYKAFDGITQSATAATVTINVNPPGGGGTLTFNPTKDTFVRSNFPSENNGAVNHLRSYKNGTTESQSYLTFTVTGLSGGVSLAKLRLFVVDASPNGGEVHTVADTTWSESTMVWTNKPAIGALIGNVGAAALNSWVEIPVTTTVTGNGTYSFAITGLSSDTTWYTSKEGTNKPELVVTPA